MLPSVQNAVPRENRQTDLKRGSNMEAYLGQITGELQSQTCTHCAGTAPSTKKPCGPWKDCVVVSGYFGRSCANCHYNNEGIRCSFRTYTVYFSCNRYICLQYGHVGGRPTKAQVNAAIEAAEAVDPNAPPSLPPVPVFTSTRARRRRTSRRVAPTNVSPTPLSGPARARRGAAATPATAAVEGTCTALYTVF